jgi:S1-C subfamily serine protease
MLSGPGCGAQAPQAPQPSLGASATAPRQSYAPVVDRVAPTVVTIRSTRHVRAAQQFPFLDDPFFRQFFGDRDPDPRQQDRSLLQRGLGSGVIVSADGYILTNHHVIDGAERITVILGDRRSFGARVIGSDSPSDLALLKIEAGNLPALPLGDSDQVRVGDLCLALGNPLGIGQTVTSGIISARGRATGLSDGSFEDFLQTDAAIGFAIPSNMARNVMEQLKNGGKVRRGRLGIGVQDLTSDLASSMGLDEVRGVLVNGVDADGPAERAGLRIEDIVTAVNGERVDGANALRNHIAALRPGTDVTLTLQREGRERQVRVRIAEQTSDQEPGASSADSARPREALGMTVGPLTPQLATQLGLDRNAQGMVITRVDPAGAAAEAGIQAGDVITQVNRQAVRSAADLNAALKRSGSRPALLLVNRNGRGLFLAVQAP